MRGLLSAMLLVASLQTGLLGEAADALRSDPVYVHPDAERSIPADAAESLRAQIAESGQPLFVAILPDAAVDETGGDVDQLPAALGDEVGLAGTYAVVAGERFRAASSALPDGQAGALATAAFQANAAAGTEAVLEDFVTRVAEAAEGGGGGVVVPGPQPTTAPAGGDAGEEATDEPSGNGGVSDLALLGLLVAGGGGLLLWRGSRRRREEAELRRATAADRQMLLAELSVLGDDVIALEHQVTLHPEARPDYDAGVSRFRAAHAALDYADDEIDLVRVDRVIEEGRYAMSRARARIEGREPPAPPPELTRRGRHDEPPVELDERGEPVYAGYGPFYGGGWYGGGGGLFSGLLLGSILSPWGWGGMWGGGLGGGDEIHVDGGDGGDWGGDFGGGGDWGGDFGGDIGGGDWG